MNRARKFVTMKMKKRSELRTTKTGIKDKKKMRKLLSDQILSQLRAQFEQQGMVEDGEAEGAVSQEGDG